MGSGGAAREDKGSSTDVNGSGESWLANNAEVGQWKHWSNLNAIGAKAWDKLGGISGKGKAFSITPAAKLQKQTPRRGGGKVA